jgi:hypothetical protein
MKSRILALALGLCFAAPVFAVHNEGVFELDGNATNDPAKPGIDWADVFANPGVGQSFIPDAVSTSDTIFIGGGSKDERDISALGITNTFWQNTIGSAPDKDDLENAFAALFTVNDHEIVYFGADRFSNSGDSAIGFWFFRSAVAVGASGNFVGKHSVGDILVTSDFLQGGGASVINVFKWNGNAGSPLTLLAHSEIKNGVPVGGTIDPATGLFCTTDDVACAVANKAATPAPWSYNFKGVGLDANLPQGTLFEGGVDLTALLGGSECFSNFLVMSRTSASTTAQLKDFVLGPFKNCSIAIAKTCSVGRLTTAADNTSLLFSVDYSGQVTNTSDGSLPIGTVITVRDDVGTPGTLADDQTQTFTLAAPLAKNGTQAFSGSFFSNDNGPHNTVFGSASFSGNTLSATNTFDCTPLPLSPDIHVTKTCNTVELVPQNGVLVAQVKVSGQVCNTSQTTGLDLDVTVADDAVGINNPPDPTQVYSGHLVQGACADYSYTYQPNAGDGSTSPASGGLFSDTVTAMGTNPAIPVANQPTDMATAHCSVCPAPQP